MAAQNGVEKKLFEKISRKMAVLTPQQIVKELNKYIIGQDEAKKVVAIALRNRWRRLLVPEQMREEIMPNNIILIGPTGVGKTEIARRLARIANAPFLKVEATKFTEVGYVGRDVESMVRDLVDLAVSMVKQQKTEEVRKAAEKVVEERILDLLVPPPPTTLSFGTVEDETTQNTREVFRQKLRTGELDDRTIEIELTREQVPTMHMMGPIGLDELGINIQEIFSGVFPKKKKKRRVTIAEARSLLLNEESEKMIDMDAVVQEALFLAQTSGIIFIDEIDKIATTASTGSGPDVSRQGVQRDLLPIVEGTTVSTKYGPVKTDHILFIASGAFHVAKPSDLIPELQGRFPIRVELHSLTEEDFYKILTIPENALIKQYQALLKTEGVTLEFDDDAIREIARIAAYVNEEITNIGARRLHTVLSTLLEDILFNAPDNLEDSTVRITKEQVTEKLSSIAQDEDLSKYIL